MDGLIWMVAELIFSAVLLVMHNLYLDWGTDTNNRIKFLEPEEWKEKTEYLLVKQCKGNKQGMY